MLTTNDVKNEVATYRRPALREAGERVLAKLEALCGPSGEPIACAHLEHLAAMSTDLQELLVISELCRLANFELWPRPAPLTMTETPLVERTRRISDMIASTLGKPGGAR